MAGIANTVFMVGGLSHRVRPDRLALGFVVLALWGLAVPLQAQTLQQAVILGAKRDPAITAMRQLVARETSNIEISKDARRPQFSIAGDTGDEADELGIRLTASQLLFDWGLSKSRIAEAEAVRVKAVADLKAEVENFTLEMSRLYFELMANERRIARTREYVAFARRLAQFSRQRVRAGLANSAETAQARLEIRRAEEELYQRQSDHDIAMAELEFLLGQRATSIVPPPELSFVERMSSSRNVIAAVASSPEYVSATADLAIAKAGVRAAKALRKPTLKLEAQVRQELAGGRGRSSSSAGITAGYDLTSSRFQGRAVIAAEQSLRAAEQRRLGVERDLQNELRSSLQRLKALAVSKRSLIAQVSEAHVVLKTYEEQFQVGQRDLIDVLTTGRDLFEAQMREIDVTDELQRKEYEAARSVGLLGAFLLSSRSKATVE